MGKRGPKPIGSQNIRVLDAPKQRRPNPMPGMRSKARTVWKRIVNQYPPEHFQPQHYDLLRAFCESSATHKDMVADIQQEGYTVMNVKNGAIKENPKIGIMDKMAGRMAALAVKLGITKNATINRDPNQQPEKKKQSKRAGLMFKG